MAVQPARMSRADLRHLPAAPRLRTVRTGRVAASAQVATRTLRVPARPASRAATQVTRSVAATPWAIVAPGLRSRLRPSAMVLGVIIVFTMLGLVYVTQALAAQNARYTVDRLLVQRAELMRTLGSQEATIVSWGSEAKVVAWAQDQGLDRLGRPERVKAR